MILLIDNYDSFTYNIAQALGGLGQDVKVVRNDAISLAGIQSLKPRALIFSPGPGRPENAGITCAAIERFAGSVPMLGVCLGHQAMGLVLGGRVVRAAQPVHGKTWPILHDGQGLFEGLPSPLIASRYHSLVVEAPGLSPQFVVSARSAEGEIMGLRVEAMKLEGLQFHPESMGTPQGETMFVNFLRLAGLRPQALSLETAA